MNEPMTMVLADREFAVPPFPIRINRSAYPICRKMENAGFTEKVAGLGSIDFTDDEMDDLVKLAYLAARAAEPGLTQDEFNDLAITPPQLTIAYFVIRLQTGGWIASTEGEKPTGEAKGAAKPPK